MGLLLRREGQEHREKVGPKSLALKVYQKRKNEVQERRFFPERIRRREVLLSKHIDDYLKRNEDRLRWFDHYERYGKLFTEAFKGKTLREILPGDVDRYVAKRRQDKTAKHEKRKKPLAPASINRELAFLRRVFNVAIEDGLLEANPVRPKMFAKENNARTRFLSLEEEAQLRKAVAADKWPVIAVAIHTGLRRGEQFGLEWENVNFTTGLLTVPRSKHGEARRVAMNETVRSALRDLPSRLQSAYVFPSETGETPLDAQNFYNRVYLPALKVAEIDGLRWHDLRHTFASRLVMAGVDLRTVQELLGHKTIQMTLRYSHLSPAHQLDAVRRLDVLVLDATDTTTDTEKEVAQAAVGGDAEVLDLEEEENGGAQNRTADLGIMRPSL